jgi:type III restriction enzyme
MRMPKLKYFKNDELNNAYVFTNFEKIEIWDWEAKEFFKTYNSYKKDEYENILLKDSVYLKRIDQNTLSPSTEFAEVFYDVFLQTFWWNKENFTEINVEKLNDYDGVNLHKTYKSNILLENKLIWVDKIKDDIRIWETKTDEKVIEARFKKLLDQFVSWYNKTKSAGILKQAIFNSFNHFLWYKNKKQIDILNIVITNEDFFQDISSRAIKKFEPLRQEKIRKLYPKEEYEFKIPEYESFSEKCLEQKFNKYFLEPCYFCKDSDLELEFANYIDTKWDISFWYKNWVSNKKYFWIEYFNADKERESIFYPDFIVKYTDWRIWIFDTKWWITAKPMETRWKAEALQKYCKKYENIFWWIIIKEKNNFYINSNERYEFLNDNFAGWEKF